MNKKIVLLFIILVFAIGSFHVSDASAAEETVIIRDGSTVIFNGSVPLPSTGTVSISDKNGTAHNVNAQSVLALLTTVDASSDAFAISDLEYYDSFGSFYLKCVTPNGGTEACDNWQYAVGATTPGTGIDTTILSGGETIGLYFGNPHQVSFDTTSIAAGGSFTATAQKYNYANDSWNPLSGVTIGATQPDPNDPWNPTVITTQAVDGNGMATITLSDNGLYDVGIAEDYYYPSYTVAVGVPNPNPNPISVGGGGPQLLPPPFSVPEALTFLSSTENPDGSFGAGMYTDWAAIALASGGAPTESVLDYMASHNTVSSFLTDNERRAMALLALGQNPYDFNGIHYIDAINASFDGVQFGDASLINDDVFALIPLLASGYTQSDDIIAKDIQFIISKQRGNGSWEGSVDLTAATIQALSPFNSVTNVSDALSKAGVYLSNSQGLDGGWGNISSSSWAIQAMYSLDTSWTKNDRTTDQYLSLEQAVDGAASPVNETQDNRIWATSYAIPAALGKPWNTILHTVAKPIPPVAVDTEEEIATPVIDIPAIVQAPMPPKKVSILPAQNISGSAEQEAIPAATEEQTPLLVATTTKSGTKIPLPITIGAIILLSVSGMVTFLLSKRVK